MSTKYSLEVIEEARKMYVASQASSVTIAEELSRRLGKYVPPSTVNAWCKHGNWNEDRKALMMERLSGQGRAMDVEMDDRTREHLRMYELMIHRGGNALEMETVEITKPSEAAELIDKGIKGERDVRSGAIALKLVNNLIDILKAEIEDPEILGRVSLKLRALLTR